ncbi:hypothetical protein [Sulfurimonas sp. NWX367]|uniref:hypothetical protein n=1 Tax=Sulfurimonas sp. NWX367 TaxID=2925413 RepID=UPI00320471FA
MFHNDLLIAFIVMGILFLRQIAILKRPDKINYAPLVLAIGVIATLVHFILHTQYADILLLVKESLFPLLFALILYVIMNIFHQTQQSQFMKMQLAQLESIIHADRDIQRVEEQNIVLETSNKLSALIKDFESEILLLKSHAGSINTTLSESEAKLLNVKNQSEMIIKQIVLSVKNMQELEKTTASFPKIFSQLNSVIQEIEAIKSDYITSYKELENLLKRLEKKLF